MRQPKTVCIYGFDGFDADVAINLRALYESLGFHVFQSRHFMPADILCIQRGADVDLAVPAYGQVHVFDYVGKPLHKMLLALSAQSSVHVFTSNLHRAANYRECADLNGINFHVQSPPVSVDVWRRKVSALKYPVVHVGNLKPFYRDGSDSHAAAFLARLSQLDVQVWGGGWDFGGKAIIARGQAKIHAVSEIYASSALSLGMMYPFQRHVTISGRFWQAPLNGCLLLSEAPPPSGEIPGVAVVQYADDGHLQELLHRDHDRTALQAEASQFWYEHFLSVKQAVSEALLSSQDSDPFSSWRKVIALRSAQPRDRLKKIAQDLRLR